MEDETVSPLYIKGFNNGYILEQFEPKLLKQLLSPANKTHEYFKALAAGKRQYEWEIAYKELKATKQKSKEIEKDDQLEYGDI